MPEPALQQESETEDHVVIHDQMISNVVQIGRIVKAEKDDPKPPKKGAAVLVHIGGEEKGTFTRNWMPWVTTRAGAESEWWMPEIDEQVVVAAPSGNLSLGIIIGIVFRGDWLTMKMKKKPEDAAKENEKQPKEAKQHIHRLIYKDGSDIAYDNKLHKYSIQLKEKQETKKFAAAISSTVKGKEGELIITMGEEEKKQTIMNLKTGTAEITVPEEITLTCDKNTVAMKKEDITLTCDKNTVVMKKGDITLTSDKNTVTMNDKSIKLEVGGSFIEIKSDSIVIKSGSTLTLNSSGADVK